ncbi:RICIN domain-containing protein [Streptomyces sp. NBC_00704]|uniref:RICIN domain-containing protein n=1 Tax=Streptomyces sp. NBC_00704 TaxID=2975809 RepID=UPI003FA76B5B
MRRFAARLLGLTALPAVTPGPTAPAHAGPTAPAATRAAPQQYTCNGTTAQQFRFRPTDSGYARIEIRGDPRQVVDVTGVSGADGAPLQRWSYGGGGNQQWRPVPEPGGGYRFTARHSGKCPSTTGGSADCVALVQRTCDGSAAQTFRLTSHP